jgi:hypothetical protein
MVIYVGLLVYVTRCWLGAEKHGRLNVDDTYASQALYVLHAYLDHTWLLL